MWAALYEDVFITIEMWKWINIVFAEKHSLCSSWWKHLASDDVHKYKVQIWENNWKGAIPRWRSVKFNYISCDCCFATRIYGGLWVSPSIIDKCWTRRWNYAVPEKQTFKSITWSFFLCVCVCTDTFALPYFIRMMKICSSLFLCPQGLIFSLPNVALLNKYMQTRYFFIAYNPDAVRRLIKCIQKDHEYSYPYLCIQLCL